MTLGSDSDGSLGTGEDDVGDGHAIRRHSSRRTVKVVLLDATAFEKIAESQREGLINAEDEPEGRRWARRKRRTRRRTSRC